MSTGIIGGTKYQWIGSRDSNGYPMGSLTTPETPSQDTLYTPIVRDCGFVQKSAMGIESSIITWFEGNQICGKLDMGVSDVTEFEVEFASVSFEYDDFTAGRTETSPASGWQVGGVNTGETLLPERFAAFGTFFKTTSTLEYLTSIYHNTQIRHPDMAYSQSDGQNPNNLNHTITPSQATRLVTGDPVGSTYEAYRYVMHISSTLGWMFTETYIGDNSETTTTLSYLPTSSDATGAATVRITVAGATQTVTSVNTSTGVVTFSSAPAADAIVVITYPTLFVPTS